MTTYDLLPLWDEEGQPAWSIYEMLAPTRDLDPVVMECPYCGTPMTRFQPYCVCMEPVDGCGRVSLREGGEGLR